MFRSIFVTGFSLHHSNNGVQRCVRCVCAVDKWIDNDKCATDRDFDTVVLFVCQCCARVCVCVCSSVHMCASVILFWSCFFTVLCVWSVLFSLCACGSVNLPVNFAIIISVRPVDWLHTLVFVYELIFDAYNFMCSAHSSILLFFNRKTPMCTRFGDNASNRVSSVHVHPRQVFRELSTHSVFCLCLFTSV